MTAVVAGLAPAADVAELDGLPYTGDDRFEVPDDGILTARSDNDDVNDADGSSERNELLLAYGSP